MRVALATVTFQRPAAIQRLVRSVRAVFPKMPIYVGDQSEPNAFMDGFYRDNGVQLLQFDFDAGVAHCRNEVVSAVEEDFVLICDDDTIFTGETSIERAAAILDGSPDIGVVGGRLKDITSHVDGFRSADLHWETNLFYDGKAGSLLSVPVHLMKAEPQSRAGAVIFPCDTVLNFALFRRSAFDENVSWDPQFKSNGEHDDFYLSWKQRSHLRVVYLPTMIAEHHHPRLVGYQRFRDRTAGWELFFRKWGIRQHLELGRGTRTLTEVAAVTEMEDLGYTKETLAAMTRARSHFYQVAAMQTEKASLLDVVPIDATVMRSAAAPRDEAASIQFADSPDAVALFMAYRREHRIGSDLTVFVRPDADGVVGGNAMGHALRYSWRKGMDYLAFNVPLEIYRGLPVWSEWTAFNVPAPEINGLLTLELAVCDQHGASPVHRVHGHVLFSEERRFGETDDWVFGWSLARCGGHDAGSESPAQVRERVEAFGTNEGKPLGLVTIDVPRPLSGNPGTLSHGRYELRNEDIPAKLILRSPLR